VVFCRDVVHGNLPASALFDCDSLVTELLELIKEDAFFTRLDDCAPGADVVNELAADAFDENYTARAVVVPLCLVAELFRCPCNPAAAWHLLRARAAEFGLTEYCSGMWLLLQALASAEHREDSCVPLALMDGNAHFVSARRSTLESILPALGATVSSVPPPSSSAGDAVGTATLAAAIEAATRPAASKIVLVEEKWPHSYGRLLLLTGVPTVAELHDFWHEYANQKKAQRWAFVQSATFSMAESLGLEAPTIVAKTVEVLDSLVLAGASEDSLSKGLTIW
jgi:hypothetical protein